MDNLRNVQLKCLEIVEKIDEVCRKYNICYSLSGGSAIGAYLHKGFIPWDDDIDIFMTRDNYEKFLEVCQKELPEHYSVENYENGRDRYLLFSKVVDNNTTAIELKADGRKVVSGIFVDVSVLDKIPRNKAHRYWFYMLAKLVQFARDRGYEPVKSPKEILKNIGTFCFNPFRNSIYCFAKWQITKKRTGEYDYAELMAGLLIAYDRELLEDYDAILFEGKELMIVKNYVRYLEVRYNRKVFYDKLQEGEEPHYHLVFADCTKPYKEYMSTASFIDKLK